jgi:hypothetical protein
MHFLSSDQLFVYLGWLGADGLGETDGETPPLSLLEGFEQRRRQVVYVEV